MIFSDHTLRELLEAGTIKIDPPVDYRTQLQPCSIDLHLGENFAFFDAQNGRPFITPIDPQENNSALYHHFETDVAVLPSLGFLLGHTRERVEVPSDMLMEVEGCSSLARLGLAVHITAGHVDPGYRGNITLELFNASPYPILLAAGMRICQVKVQALDRPSERAYGTNRPSRYQDSEGVVVSRSHLG